MQSKVTSIIFFITLLVCISSLKIKANMKSKIPQLKKSTFYLTVDNTFQTLYINNNEVTLPFKLEELGEWKVTKKFEITLRPGNVIAIKGKNNGYTSGIIGTLHYVDKNGVESLFNTGKGWICCAAPAKLVGKNDGKNVGFAKGWTQITEIDTTSRWIWDIKSGVIGTETVCSFTIPNNIE